MSNPLVASAQYDDLVGSIAIDGFDGPFLQELRKYCSIRAGYWPVGFEFYEEQPKSIPEVIELRIFAVDANRVGVQIDEIKAYADRHGELPVFDFSCQIPIIDFLKLIKRISVAAMNRQLEGVKFTRAGSIDNEEE